MNVALVKRQLAGTKGHIKTPSAGFHTFTLERGGAARRLDDLLNTQWCKVERHSADSNLRLDRTGINVSGNHHSFIIHSTETRNGREGAIGAVRKPYPTAAW